MKKLILVDGYSLAFRAFFAIPVDTMVTSSGQHTNALYGFLSMVIGLIEEQRPTHMAIALDRSEPTFRDGLNAAYKAHRPETHPGLRTQLELLERAITSLGLVVVSKAGFEADDVLAALSDLGRNEEMETIVVTGDRDSFQLVSDPYVKVLYNRRGVSDYLMLDEAGVIAKVGAEPSVYPFLAAMRGDPSDNLAGIPGIGVKTAAKLAHEYRSVDNLLANLDALPPKLAASLRDNLDTLKLNASLTPLQHHLDLDVALDDLALAPIDDAKAGEFFDFMESKRLAARAFKAWDYIGHLPGSRDSGSASEVPRADQTVLSDLQLFFAMREKLEPRWGVAVQWAHEAGRSRITTLALAGCMRGSPKEIVSAAEEVPAQDEAGFLKGVLDSVGGVAVTGVSLKELLRRLLELSLPLPDIDMDLGLAAYVMDSSLGDYSLGFLLGHYREQVPQLNSPSTPTGAAADLFSAGDTTAAAREAAESLLLAEVLRGEIQGAEMGWLYEKVEQPLLVVLAKMEAAGIGVDREVLVELAKEFVAEAARLGESIRAMAGRNLNVNSTKQLGEVLFGELGLVPPKKTKTGFSTDAQTLEKLRGSHPIIEEILRYREVEKLRSTYGQSLIAEVAPDGRIHATFNQMVARTGRLSSDHPNLHNIPIRTEIGKRFRYAFVAPSGSKLVVADYSQIELRVIAHLSGDPGLIEAFTSGADIHTRTAARVFGVDPAEVTSPQRAKAKMVAYGLAYGMEAYGLASRLNVEVPEAESILRSFFEAFPSVRRYMDEVVEKARSLGYTETEFGRRRRIPELLDENFRIRQAAERQAMNSGIQGLAADIFKIALVNLDRALDPAQGFVVLQVHDEILVEAKVQYAQEIRDTVAKTMESAAQLRVPLTVNSYVVQRWGEAK